MFVANIFGHFQEECCLGDTAVNKPASSAAVAHDNKSPYGAIVRQRVHCTSMEIEFGCMQLQMGGGVGNVAGCMS